MALDRTDIVDKLAALRAPHVDAVKVLTDAMEAVQTPIVTPPVEPPPPAQPPNTVPNPAGGWNSAPCPEGQHRHLNDPADVTKGYGPCEPNHVPVPVPIAAVRLENDVTTKGDWVGKYGSSVVEMPGDPCGFTGTVFVWDETTGDRRALLRGPGGTGNAGNQGRIASCWYSDSEVAYTCDHFPGKGCFLTLYLLDWDRLGRSERVELRKIEDHTLVDSVEVKDFQEGVYLRWILNEAVWVRIVSTNTALNPVVSGVFVDPPEGWVPPPPLPEPTHSCPAGQHWDEGMGMCMPDVAVPPTPTQPPPAPADLPPVNIVQVVPGDDSVAVRVRREYGAKDMRLWLLGKPNVLKYGGQLPDAPYWEVNSQATPWQPDFSTIHAEYNGLGLDEEELVVELLRDTGPFQHPIAGMEAAVQHLNGQGDPSVPVEVIARSIIKVQGKPIEMPKGSKVFLDRFKGNKMLQINGNKGQYPESEAMRVGAYNEYDDENFIISTHLADPKNTFVFRHDNHIMSILADAARVTNASIMFQCRETFDCSGGKVLYARGEWDAHNTSRRWQVWTFWPAGEPYYTPGKVDPDDKGVRPRRNLSNREIRHEVAFNRHELYVSDGTDEGFMYPYTPANDWNPPTWRRHWTGMPQSDGTPFEIDFRHLIQTFVYPDKVVIAESDPLGKLWNLHSFQLLKPRPFENFSVGIIQQLYHTSLEHQEMEPWKAIANYWFNYMPTQDERHWDNLGFAVLDAKTADKMIAGFGTPPNLL